VSNDGDGPSPASLKQRLRQFSTIGFALVLGGAGGYLFLLAKMPLPWMMGAMCVTTAAALAGVPMRGPGHFREYMIAIIGLMVGSAFTPEILDQLSHWVISLSALAVYTIVTIFILGCALRWWLNFHPADAFCSAAPGGFVEMVILGGAMGGDERVISLMHSVRILLTVIVIPFWFRIFHDYVPSGTAIFGKLEDLPVEGAVILVASGLIGFFGGRAVRLPLYFLIGPMVVSALVHAFGLSTARPPSEVVAFAQVVMGVGIGCRFQGTPLREILSVLKAAVAMTLGMVAIAILSAYGVYLATDLSFEALILAFSPGGVAEMNVISVSLNIDPVFVATHHLARLALLILVAPLFLKLFTTWGAAWIKPRQPSGDG
jgi:uncharacterized protein